MDRHYENYSEDIKDYIRFSCPYKIGDRIIIKTTYNGRNSDVDVTHHCEIIDIQVSTKRHLLYRNGLSELFDYLDDRADRILDDPIQEFTLTYRYEEKIPRKSKIAFWEHQNTRMVESTITVDGFGCNIHKSSILRKTIDKE